MKGKTLLALILISSLPPMVAGAQNLIPWYNRAIIPLAPDSVEASSICPADSYSYGPEHLLDGDRDSAWFSAGGDNRPSVTFDFGRPVVVHAVKMINGWPINQLNWDANARAKNLRFVFSDGTVVEETLEDAEYPQYFQFGETVYPESRPATWMRIEIVGTYRGSQFPDPGLSEVTALGHYHDPGQTTLRDLATATVTFRREVVIEANQRQSFQISALDSKDAIRLIAEGRRPNDYEEHHIRIRIQAVPPQTSPNDRVIRPGRSFTVENVVDGDGFVDLVCSDGTRIRMGTNERLSPMGAFGEYTVEELNVLLDGILEFSDCRGRQVSDY